jgi:hypothetical protein
LIYIKYKDDEFYIDSNGFIVSDAPQNGLAIFTETSTAGTAAVRTHPYYGINKPTGIHFFEKRTYGDNAKSLLQALNVRSGILTGIYFSKRLLLFEYKGSQAINLRFTADDIDDIAGEIKHSIKRWDLPENTPYEVYGFNLPFEALSEIIKNTPALKNIEKEKKARHSRRLAAAFVLMLAALAVWGAIRLQVSAAASKIEEIKQLKAAISIVLREEAVKRLPLYLQSVNIPLDRVLYSLSFLEKRKYTSINISVANDGKMKVALNTASPDEAYLINQAIKDAQIKINGGVIEISFSKAIQKTPAGSGGSDYIRYFDF